VTGGSVPVLLRLVDGDVTPGLANASFAACPANTNTAAGSAGTFTASIYVCSYVNDGTNDTLDVEAYWDVDASGTVTGPDVPLGTVTVTVTDS